MERPPTPTPTRAYVRARSSCASPEALRCPVRASAPFWGLWSLLHTAAHTEALSGSGRATRSSPLLPSAEGRAHTLSHTPQEQERQAGPAPCGGSHLLLIPPETGRHPRHEGLTVAAPCGATGFDHCPLVGKGRGEGEEGRSPEHPQDERTPSTWSSNHPNPPSSWPHLPASRREPDSASQRPSDAPCGGLPPFGWRCSTPLSYLPTGRISARLRRSETALG